MCKTFNDAGCSKIGILNKGELVMQRITCLCIMACLLVAFTGMAAARIDRVDREKSASLTDERLDLGIAAAVPEEFFNVLHIGALWFPAVSNKGYIGYFDISAFYPGGGAVSAIWQAGMWAGGYVEGNTNAWVYMGADGYSSDPANYDALDEQAIVETETDLALPYPYRRLTVHVNTANKPDIPAGCTGNECTDGDLGMDVTYEWHQWGVPGYDHWVFIHVIVAFSKDIDTYYWGWMSDCDVGDVSLSSYYFDDYAGWDDTYKFCYMRDWDYDPLEGQPYAPSTEDSIFLTPNVIGQYLLAAPPVGGPITADPSPTQKWVSKNYWDWNNDVSSVQDMYDRLTGIWENPFPPLEEFDYRILNGVGPYDVSAGDTAHFWMAYVIGEDYDEGSHATYGMGTLVDHVLQAWVFYAVGMVIPADEYPPRAPDLDPELEIDVIDDTLMVHWAPYEDIPAGAAADSFIVFRSVIDKLGPWERVAAFENSVTEMHLGLVSGCNYVWVQAYDTDNETGSNPYALSSRLYARDDNGIIRANDNSIVCVSPQITVSIVTEPVDLAISVDGSPFQAPYQFLTGTGFNHLIGTDSLQVAGDSTFVFTGWSDGGTATHLFTAGAEDTLLTASFDLITSWARIDSIVDVPDDQGGWVRAHFTRSGRDFPEEMALPIASYGIWRLVESSPLLAALEAQASPPEEKRETGGTPDLTGMPVVTYMGKIYIQSSPDLAASSFPPGTWELVISVPAVQQDDYIVAVPTLADSCAVGTNYAVLVITAHTTTPSIWYVSEPDSGYSVDNIAPGVPEGFAVAYNTGSGTELTWDECPDEDFQYFRVYRGESEDFDPTSENLVHSTAGTEWLDTVEEGWRYYYKITALDHVGNESEAASPETVTGDETPQVPNAFALYQNIPNPFNPVTTIRFDLPRPAQVRLCVYNVKGELVASLADEYMTEGRKEVGWEARDNEGRAVASGVYFYRLTAGDFVQTKKMVLLR
jgi:hypothetical protein